MTNDRRGMDRSRGFARAGLVPSCFGYVADVSRRGFRAVFSEDPKLRKGMLVVPVLSFAEIGIEPFALPSDVRWIEREQGAWKIGFQVRSPLPEGPAERDFRSIYEYYLGY